MKKHREIRELLSTYMYMNWEKFMGEDMSLETEFKVHCEELRNNGIVGDNIELMALSLMCEQSVEVYTLPNCQELGFDRPERVFNEDATSRKIIRLLQASDS